MSTPSHDAGWGPVTPLMVDHLRRTRPWLLFFAILFVIGAAFAVLGGLMMLVIGVVGPPPSPGQPEMPKGFFPILGLVYLVASLFYLVFAVLMFRQASAISALVHAPDVPTVTAKMELALDRVRGFWKTAGLVTIVSIVLYLVLIVVMVAVMAAAMPGFPKSG